MNGPRAVSGDLRQTCASDAEGLGPLGRLVQQPGALLAERCHHAGLDGARVDGVEDAGLAVGADQAEPEEQVEGGRSLASAAIRGSPSLIPPSATISS